ncbi:MAG: M48 family metalloprotease [Deltaproteobacteria bacterium]|nr:M48 family metalloprotease [Deltaproteobacteria bacterium]MDQ3297082.1 M48 family metalloprotease [Myxococcota bacterium]
MSLGAVAGFALVFVVTTWTISALGVLALAQARSCLQRVGPMAERRAAEAVAIVPVVLGILAVVTLLLQSTVGVDHCEAHGHHAHLCVTHGAQWIERTWVVVGLAIVAATLLGRTVVVAASFLRGARSIRELHALSSAASGVRLVDSDRAFCFVARSGIYVSSRVWTSLSEGERAALVAHEAAHVRHGDLRTRAVLEAFLVLAAPLVGDRVRSAWLGASERLCDAHAASVTGEPEVVATAMVSMCRLHATQPVQASGFTPTVEEVEGRVRAVLAGGPLGAREAVVLARVVIATCVVLAIAGVVAAEPVHHAFETVLG